MSTSELLNFTANLSIMLLTSTHNILKAASANLIVLKLIRSEDITMALAALSAVDANIIAAETIINAVTIITLYAEEISIDKQLINDVNAEVDKIKVNILLVKLSSDNTKHLAKNIYDLMIITRKLLSDIVIKITPTDACVGISFSFLVDLIDEIKNVAASNAQIFISPDLDIILFANILSDYHEVYNLSKIPKLISLISTSDQTKSEQILKYISDFVTWRNNNIKDMNTKLKFFGNN